MASVQGLPDGQAVLPKRLIAVDQGSSGAGESSHEVWKGARKRDRVTELQRGSRCHGGGRAGPGLFIRLFQSSGGAPIPDMPPSRAHGAAGG